MSRQSAYFMHDQVRHRVAQLTAASARRPLPGAVLASPVWPLLAVVVALTAVNLVAAFPAP